jgi:hypothetical protein
VEKAGSNKLKFPRPPLRVNLAVDDSIPKRLNAAKRRLGESALEVRVSLVLTQARVEDRAIKSEQGIKAPLVAAGERVLIGTVTPDHPQKVSKAKNQWVQCVGQPTLRE